jgi:uncharacterized protein RhaS with RHS repeats
MDPEGTQDGPNLYAYVHNNPLSKYDLYGLFEMGSFSLFQKNEIKINYCDYFEEIYPNSNYERSELYDLSDLDLLELPKDMGIGWINGIWNCKDGSRESAKYISDLSGGYNRFIRFCRTHLERKA